MAPINGRADCVLMPLVQLCGGFRGPLIRMATVGSLCGTFDIKQAGNYFSHISARITGMRHHTWLGLDNSEWWLLEKRNLSVTHCVVLSKS